MKHPTPKNGAQKHTDSGRFQAKKGWNSPFTMVPNEILDGTADCPPLSQSQLLIYIALCRHADNATGECWPYYSTLAEKARCTVRTAISSVKYLCEVGLVTKETRRTENGGQTSNVYTVYLPSQRFANTEGNDEETSTPTENEQASTNQPEGKAATPHEMISPPRETDDTPPVKQFHGVMKRKHPPHETVSPLYKVEQTQEQTQEQGLANLPPEEREAKIKSLPPEIREPMLRFFKRLDDSGAIRRGPLDPPVHHPLQGIFGNDGAGATTEAAP